MNTSSSLQVRFQCPLASLCCMTERAVPALHWEPKSTPRQCYRCIPVIKTIRIYFPGYNQAFQVALIQPWHEMLAAAPASMIRISVIKGNIKSGLLIRESAIYYSRSAVWTCALQSLFSCECCCSHLQYSSEEYLTMQENVIRLIPFPSAKSSTQSFRIISQVNNAKREWRKQIWKQKHWRIICAFLLFVFCVKKGPCISRDRVARCLKIPF